MRRLVTPEDVGRRLLMRQGFGASVWEYKIIEVSPTGAYFKYEYAGRQHWAPTKELQVIEELPAIDAKPTDPVRVQEG